MLKVNERLMLWFTCVVKLKTHLQKQNESWIIGIIFVKEFKKYALTWKSWKADVACGKTKSLTLPGLRFENKVNTEKCHLKMLKLETQINANRSWFKQ